VLRAGPGRTTTREPSVSLAKPAATNAPAPDAAAERARHVVSAADAALMEAVRFEVKRVVVGQDRVLERMLVCLLAGGHSLLEGVPGLAKTLAAEALSTVVGGSFTRIQFTPDLIPSDIVGTRIYRTSSESFDVELGPIFSHFVLADEINRAPAKVQSALLEVMAEQHVSIGGTTYPVPLPFLVIATQNPIESEGVYPLPEAQRDRFLMKIIVDYPTPVEELEIVRRMGVDPPTAEQVITPDELARLQGIAAHVYVDPGVIDYAVRLVLATRQPELHGLAHLRPFIAFGVSPRASLGLVAAGRALAFLRGRGYVVPQDVFDVAPEVLRHRLVLTYEALADGVMVDDVVAHVLGTVIAPRISPAQDEVLIAQATQAALAEAAWAQQQWAWAQQHQQPQAAAHTAPGWAPSGGWYPDGSAHGPVSTAEYPAIVAPDAPTQPHAGVVPTGPPSAVPVVDALDPPGDGTGS
jgi:MoxR-like ATPase